MNVAVRQQSQVLNASRNAMGLTTAEGLNLSRQFADIGVTAAMGMNPLMIAIQQGPQLLDIFQTAAIRTGSTVGTVARAVGASLMAALAPFLPLILGIAAAAGALAGAWGLATRSLKTDIGDVSKEMGLTKDQLDKLKDKSVTTTATAGDSFKALGTTIKEMLVSVFGDQLSAASKWWKEFVDGATKFAVNAAAGIAAAFIGTFYAIRDNWRALPAILGDAAISAANIAIRAGSAIVNEAIKNINTLLAGLRALGAVNPALGWAGAIRDVGSVSAAPMANPFQSQAGAAVADIGAGYVRAFGQATGAMERFYNRWQSNTEATARSRILKAAGDAGDDKAGRAARPHRFVEENFVNNLDSSLRDLNIKPIQVVEPLRLIADELRLVDSLAQDAARGMADSFGEAGRAMGDLLTTMTGYQARLADINLAEKEHRLSGAQAARERGAAEVQAYGDALGAAKGFFREGSDGYRLLQAAEAAYRVFQFAMSVQAMAQGAAETGASVAGSLAKGAASAAAGAAKMFEALGPFAFPVVAAMLAVLAAVGLKGSGGGGGSGGSSKSVQNSATQAQATNAQDTQARQTFATAVAQKVEVRVTADRDGLNAYVAQTAENVARPMVVQGMAATAGATRAQVFSDLDQQRTYDRTAA